MQARSTSISININKHCLFRDQLCKRRVQQRRADEAVVRGAQVVQQQREGLDRRRPHRLLWTLQRLGEEQRAPRLAHAAGKEGQERHAVRLDLRRCEETTQGARCQRASPRTLRSGGGKSSR